MARVAVALSCTAEVMAELERLSRSRRGEVRLAERARIVLACLRGRRNDDVASEIGVRPNTVGLWRRRFAERGIAGLRDAPRPGKPAKYGVELRDRLLAQLELPPPEGMASWDGGSLVLPPVQIRVYSLPRTRFCVERDDEVQMAPRGAICWFVSAAGGGCSERRVGIELGRRPVGNELFTPGLLDLWTVDTPQSLAQQLQALEDRQGLLRRPVPRDECRGRRCRRR